MKYIWNFAPKLNVRVYILGESQNSMQHFEFSRTFLALVGLPFCPPGRYCSTATAQKSAGKFKMLYQILTLRVFSPEIHALESTGKFKWDIFWGFSNNVTSVKWPFPRPYAIYYLMKVQRQTLSQQDYDVCRCQSHKVEWFPLGPYSLFVLS